jgi:hypothetical protein
MCRLLRGLLSAIGPGGAVFGADFAVIGGDGSIEFVLHVDSGGNLASLEVDFCGNAYPVPEAVTCSEAPYHVFRSDALVGT